MLTTKEKEEALRDLDIINQQNYDANFGEYAQAVFMCTDKVMTIKEIIKKMKKAMIPTSSGESAIYLASKGVDVYTYDINALSFYTQSLRIAAHLALEYEDFISFFYSKDILAEKHYIDLRDKLNPKARFLLDKMFSSMKGEEILDKLYDMLRLCPSFLDRPEHYLDIAKVMFNTNKEKGFYETKKVNLQDKIKYTRCDILDLSSSEYKDERDFDMLFFSNILYSLPRKEKINFLRMLKTYYPNFLRKKGALVNYFHSMDGMPRHIEISEHDIFYNEIRMDELESLSDISDEFYEIGPGYNGMGLYRNDIVHLIRKM